MVHRRNPAKVGQDIGQGILNGGSITVLLTFRLTGLISLFQTSKTGGQWYSDTSPLVFPAYVSVG